MTYHAQFEQWAAVPIELVFLFFANPGNLPRYHASGNRDRTGEGLASYRPQA
jgi:uncharacterized protein YndB with AHSA1/START domain